MDWRRWFISLLVFAFALSPARTEETLADRIQEIIDRPEYKQARWGVLVVDASSGKTLYQRNSDKLFIPASVAKLFSGASALALLGQDHRFTTPVYKRGEVHDGVLEGDLIMVASGDLTFGGRRGKNGKVAYANHDHTYANSGLTAAGLTDTNPLDALDDLAKQVAATGIKEIQGEVLVDDYLFQRSRGTGTGPDLLSPIVVNDNVIDVVITPGKAPGQLASVRLRPESEFHRMDAEVVTVESDKPTRILIQSATTTAFSVRGEIAVNSPPALRIFHVDEPILFARALFIEALKRQGIRVRASLYRPSRFDLPPRKMCEKLPRVAYFTSPPLSETVTVTLKVSHNLYGSSLPLLIAAKYDEHTLDQGLRRQGTFLRELGVPVETISLSGGAGGNNADAVTPEATVKLLQAMSKRPEGEAFFGALPILGVDGTLFDVVESSSPARGKVRAKSGTLIWYDALNDRLLVRCKALAGTATTAKGSKLYFAMFVNDVALAPGATPLREVKALGKLCEVLCEYGP
jgi:D-alanyl-D-alanine carboxypeptidase/D-alanyl-D-alanine-endopeptidase (penicillin-binding protein 4)